MGFGSQNEERMILGTIPLFDFFEEFQEQTCRVQDDVGLLLKSFKRHK